MDAGSDGEQPHAVEPGGHRRADVSCRQRRIQPERADRGARLSRARRRCATGTRPGSELVAASRAIRASAREAPQFARAKGWGATCRPRPPAPASRRLQRDAAPADEAVGLRDLRRRRRPGRARRSSPPSRRDRRVPSAADGRGVDVHALLASAVPTRPTMPGTSEYWNSVRYGSSIWRLKRWPQASSRCGRCSWPSVVPTTRSARRRDERDPHEVGVVARVGLASARRP